MSSDVRVALAGIAGYGEQYLDVLLHDPNGHPVQLIGVADPAPERSRHLGALRDRGVPIHPSLETLFAASRPQLLIISTPIHLHAPQTCFALSRGASVLCEKPLAGSLRDARRMAECEHSANDHFAAIGYQWCFSDAIQSLKRDIISGVLKRPRRMKAIVLFPRAISYYARNTWAGRIRTPAGDDVLDSPVNNAASHYLHNMLYLLGETRERSATPITVQAERYRANAIENYDTAALRATMPGGCEVLFYTSHATEQRGGPRCSFEFDNAVVEYDATAGDEFIARFADGRTVNYGSPGRDRWRKVWDCVDVRHGSSDKPIACGIETATPHTICIAAAQQSASGIIDLPPALRRTRQADGKTFIYVEGLADALLDCYQRGILPAESGSYPWSRPAGDPVAAAGFDQISTA